MRTDEHKLKVCCAESQKGGLSQSTKTANTYHSITVKNKAMIEHSARISARV
jgi:hypothetical protein